MDEKKVGTARVYRGRCAAPQLTAARRGDGVQGLGFLLAFTNLYIGLKAGWCLGVAITAVVLSFSIWTSFQRFGLTKSPMSILENTCMQSMRVVRRSTARGRRSSLRCLRSCSCRRPRPTRTGTTSLGGSWVCGRCILGVLGVSLAIPMQRNLINRERLRFPEGTAAAVTLQSLYSEGRSALMKARALYVSAAVGALSPLLTALGVRRTGVPNTARVPLLPDSSRLFDWLPEIRANGRMYPLSQWTIRFDHSFLLLGAGAIVGLRTSASLVLGGLVLAYVVGPHAMEATWIDPMGDLVAAVTKPGARGMEQIGIWYGAPLIGDVRAGDALLLPERDDRARVQGGGREGVRGRRRPRADATRRGAEFVVLRSGRPLQRGDHRALVRLLPGSRC